VRKKRWSFIKIGMTLKQVSSVLELLVLPNKNLSMFGNLIFSYIKQIKSKLEIFSFFYYHIEEYATVKKYKDRDREM